MMISNPHHITLTALVQLSIKKANIKNPINNYDDKIDVILTAKTFFEGFLLAADSIFFKNPMGPKVQSCA